MRPEGPGISVHAISLGQNKEATLLLFKRFRKEESPKWNLPEFFPYGVGRPRSGPGGPERQRHANLLAEAKK